MESGAPSTRAAWVDRAKAYGIILVVLGHVWPSRHVIYHIYIFHMPLFFFLSGLTFKRFDGWTGHIDKARSLLLPYLAFGLLIAASLFAANTGFGRHLTIPGPVHFLLGGTFLTGAFGVFWFPTCLLATLFLLNFLLRFPGWAQALAIAGAMAASLWLGVGSVPYNPYGLLTVGMALPFAAAGHYVGIDRAARFDFRSVIVFVLLAAAFVLLAPHIGKVEYKYMVYGAPPWSLLAAASAIAMVVLLSMVPVPAVDSIGRASLTIMYIHLAIRLTLRPPLDWPAIILLAIVGGTLLHMLFEASAPTRRLFLGMRR